MDNFFHKDQELKHGFAGISLGGSDWLGYGKVVAGLSQGTEMCGAKPVCLSALSKDCRKRKDNYNKCVQTSLQLANQQVEQNIELGTASIQNKSQIEEQKKKQQITLAIIGAVALTVIVVTVAIIKKK